MEIQLYYSPYEIYEKYKRMTKNGVTHRETLDIIASLNATTRHKIETVIAHEKIEEERCGFLAYHHNNQRSITYSEDKKKIYIF